ncbi:MAG: hypothetical protein JWP35_361 [Caulobacter sp.]|nr:hypothetical protein [Caulobacter sp.]
MPDFIPPPTDLQAAPVHPGAPLVIVDVDEVIAHFMRGFGVFIARQGYDFRVDRFALFQNIYRPGETEPVDMTIGRELFDGFFRDGSGDLEPAIGAADALASLSTKAGVLILTNAPDCGREARGAWLKTHGFDYPLILNSSLKGPAVASLAARTSGRVAFIDDLLPNLESVAEHAPAVARFQMVADERLRPMAPAAPERHTRHDDWPTMKRAIARAIGTA